MWIERCYSTHAVEHQGGNKTHRLNEKTGLSWCGTPLPFTNQTDGVDVRDRSEAVHYISCKKCLRSIPGRVNS